MIDNPRKIVSFILYLPPTGSISTFALPPEFEVKSTKDGGSEWCVCRNGNRNSSVIELLSDVLDALTNHAEALKEMSAEAGSECILRIVQYIGDEESSPGFELAPKQMDLLADLGAHLDVDQYYYGPDGD